MFAIAPWADVGPSAPAGTGKKLKNPPPVFSALVSLKTPRAPTWTKNIGEAGGIGSGGVGVKSAALARVMVRAASNAVAQTLIEPVMNSPSMLSCGVRVHAILSFCQTIGACHERLDEHYGFFATLRSLLQTGWAILILSNMGSAALLYGPPISLSKSPEESPAGQRKRQGNEEPPYANCNQPEKRERGS